MCVSLSNWITANTALSRLISPFAALTSPLALFIIAFMSYCSIWCITAFNSLSAVFCINFIKNHSFVSTENVICNTLHRITAYYKYSGYILCRCSSLFMDICNRLLKCSVCPLRRSTMPDTAVRHIITPWKKKALKTAVFWIVGECWRISAVRVPPILPTRI